MSSRTRDKVAARERAALRAARVRAVRRRRLLLAGGAISVVLALLVALVAAQAAGFGSGGAAATTAGGTTESGSASTAVVKAVTGVPAWVLDEVGAGDVLAVPRKIKAPPLTADGKPNVLYVGAEYCPFCAAQRWPVVVALSRFGTWSGLGETTSASEDVFPDTATLSFHGATFTSEYLSFTGVETSGRDLKDGRYAPLDQLSPADQKTFERYDRPPYTDGSAGGIPFLDIAGTYLSGGASYDPQVLVGKLHRQIADALADPDNPVARAVGGSANVLTAALCKVTSQQPAAVCKAPGVIAAATALADGQRS
jgi:hypothetical protein